MRRQRLAKERRSSSSSSNAAAQVTEEDMEDLFSDVEIQKMRVSLLAWYGLNRRDLPWRVSLPEANDEDDVEKRAYRVWVSEVMLQQTRVQTVVDYFNRWMLKWPTLLHLSTASLEEVNEMWAGLGYYRRARYLLEGAKMIVSEGGQFPRTVSSLRKVPGVGEYTAGAIASIAFKEAVPVVDGNVVRVIARLKAISANPKDSATIKKFWELAAQLVDPSNPGDFNQGLMELGATICTPLSPTCSSCPVSDQCRAVSISRRDRSVLVTDYPSKGMKMKQRHDFSAVCVLEVLKGEEDMSDSEFLLVKRPDEGLLAGLWEFPSVLLDGEADVDNRREAMNRYLKAHFQIETRKAGKVMLREYVGEFVHVFSHIRLRIYVEYMVLHLKGGMKMKGAFRKRDTETPPWKYVGNDVISSMGLTSSVRKVYTMVEKFKQQKIASSNPPVPSRKRNPRSNKKGTTTTN
ncbi:A/G-specific adenine DNA glycosylase [Morus notabilis]|uniref:Adenine DNA glycosylase n=1 Tax=Morus notabilis TaxID=981085 RepID=W9QVM6_9ROSA|nr:adenine DNA glycosylase [Morus notabilis]EXB55428.1 A/G-specific adenine DNA glycosylase [Morus notabilis]